MISANVVINISEKHPVKKSFHDGNNKRFVLGQEIRSQYSLAEPVVDASVKVPEKKSIKQIQIQMVFDNSPLATLSPI